MNEDEFFEFDEWLRSKRYKLSKREVVLKHIEGEVGEQGITRITEKISPHRGDGTTEDITLVHQYILDCGCLNNEIGGVCCVCGRSFCNECVRRLRSFCAQCGHFCCPEHSFPAFANTKKVYCRFHRFSLRRLLWE